MDGSQDHEYMGNFILINKPMRYRRLKSFLIMILALPPLGWATPQKFIEYLYIDANVGGSSGGHVAVKLNDWVYHFQNEEGYTQLTREAWHRFRWVYNDIDNRNIHIARVSLTASDAERVENRLSLLFLVQNRHVDYMDALRQDQQVLDAWQGEEPLVLDGFGFFERIDHQTAAFGPLLNRINAILGNGFLGDERQRLTRQLDSLDYFAPRLSDDLTVDRYPAYRPTFSEQLLDTLARRLALDVMSRGWPLRSNLLIDADPLGHREQNWLGRYGEHLEEAILGHLTTPYPGSGKALLLALARYEAITLSLASGKLRLIDCLATEPRPSQVPLTPSEHSDLAQLRDRLMHRLPSLREDIFSMPETDEADYHRLEVAVSELREIDKGLALNRSVHFGRQLGPPRGSGYAWLDKPGLTEGQFDRYRQMAEHRADQFLSRLRENYEYHLITHNCVTELVKAVNSSFAGSDETEALGGHIEPGADQGFIPFRFFELVRQRYRVTETLTLPSYRNRTLAQLSRTGQDWATLALEGNTLTSNIYRPRQGDGAFLLFTEHELWTRPLFGIVNLGYAAGATGVGVFTSPIDGGAELLDGLSGILFSLPEIGFWNIRKGSFSRFSPDP